MAAIGLILVGFGLLTAWSGLDRVIVFDVLRGFISAPVPTRDPSGVAAAPKAA